MSNAKYPNFRPFHYPNTFEDAVKVIKNIFGEDWYTRIDLDKFDITNSDKCIIGQLCDSNSYAYRMFMRAVFDISHKDPAYIDGWYSNLRFQNSWIKTIEALRAEDSDAKPSGSPEKVEKSEKSEKTEKTENPGNAGKIVVRQGDRVFVCEHKNLPVGVPFVIVAFLTE